MTLCDVHDMQYSIGNHEHVLNSNHTAPSQVKLPIIPHHNVPPGSQNEVVERDLQRVMV